jgi:propanol-preferring alcohol dehydrogenase
MRGRGRRGSARPLVVKQVAKPVVNRGGIVVRIETSGLCHTDIHAAHGDWPVEPSPPFIPRPNDSGVLP